MKTNKTKTQVVCAVPMFIGAVFYLITNLGEKAWQVDAQNMFESAKIYGAPVLGYFPYLQIAWVTSFGGVVPQTFALLCIILLTGSLSLTICQMQVWLKFKTTTLAIISTTAPIITIMYFFRESVGYDSLGASCCVFMIYFSCKLLFEFNNTAKNKPTKLVKTYLSAKKSTQNQTTKLVVLSIAFMFFFILFYLMRPNHYIPATVYIIAFLITSLIIIKNSKPIIADVSKKNRFAGKTKYYAVSLLIILVCSGTIINTGTNMSLKYNDLSMDYIYQKASDNSQNTNNPKTVEQIKKEQKEHTASIALPTGCFLGTPTSVALFTKMRMNYNYIDFNETNYFKNIYNQEFVNKLPKNTTLFDDFIVSAAREKACAPSMNEYFNDMVKVTKAHPVETVQTFFEINRSLLIPGSVTCPYDYSGDYGCQTSPGETLLSKAKFYLWKSVFGNPAVWFWLMFVLLIIAIIKRKSIYSKMALTILQVPLFIALPLAIFSPGILNRYTILLPVCEIIAMILLFSHKIHKTKNI